MSAIDQAKPIPAAGGSSKSLRSSELLLSTLRYAILIVLRSRSMPSANGYKVSWFR